MSRAKSHQVHQRLDEKADRISSGLNDLHCTLVCTLPQVHAVHLNYSISDLKARTLGKLRSEGARGQKRRVVNAIADNEISGVTAFRIEAFGFSGKAAGDNNISGNLVIAAPKSAAFARTRIRSNGRSHRIDSRSSVRKDAFSRHRLRGGNQSGGNPPALSHFYDE